VSGQGGRIQTFAVFTSDLQSDPALQLRRSPYFRQQKRPINTDPRDWGGNREVGILPFLSMTCIY